MYSFTGFPVIFFTVRLLVHSLSSPTPPPLFFPTTLVVFHRTPDRDHCSPLSDRRTSRNPPAKCVVCPILRRSPVTSTVALRRPLPMNSKEYGERHRSSTAGAVPGMSKYEEIIGPIIEEYERHTNELVEEKEEELTQLSERKVTTELYVEELHIIQSLDIV
ncbi:hypothetical protein EW146_g10440 [Bondarzewia mesenterica]|uniref:Uncharacterized protein n=1 Tax=Bondarzewia mesenterica TaxID=1095465 RepID=A0A4V3XBV6_9AGAM|nr:hypothetical protein EW146_g10440 [Bondarzewia mesenterica]